MKETIAEKFLKTTKRRFLSLCASALLGLALLWLLNFIVNLSPDNKILKILEFLKIPEILEFLRILEILEVLKIILDKLSILIVSLPTAIFLWWFRTHDVKQGLKQSKDSYHQSKESYYQSDFFDGLDRLVSDEPLNIDLGVAKLIALSEKDGSHDERIHLAFSKRLKHLPKEYKDLLSEIDDIKKEIVKLEIVRLKKEQATEKEQELTKKSQELEEQARRKPKLTYAQHILPWFKDKAMEIEDIDGTRFDFQEFVLDVSGLDVYKQAENPLVYFLKQNNSFKNITFIYANLQVANLAGVDLRGTNLAGVDLLGADLRGANLSLAKLERANLHGADLRGAKLEGVNLYGANLYGANLEGANLQVTQLVGAYLLGANLRGARLEWANFLGANLERADLRGANFLGANLEGAQLPEGIMKYPREQ